MLTRRKLELQDIIKSHTFVGLVGADRPQSLLQFETKLYLVDHCQLGEELFYQLGLKQFGSIGKLVLNPPPLVNELLELAVSCQAEAEQATGLKVENIVTKLVHTLLSVKEMLLEYFSLDISPEGKLLALPMLLTGYKPNLDRLPLCTSFSPFNTASNAKVYFTVLLRAALQVSRSISLGITKNAG